MKRHLFAVIFSAVLVVSSLTSQDYSAAGGAGDGKTAAGENRGISSTPGGDNEYTEEKKEDYLSNTRERLYEFDSKIKALEAKIKEKAAEARKEVQEGLKELRKKRAELAKEIRRLESSGNKTWHNAKKKVETALEALSKAYEKVRSFFGPEQERPGGVSSGVRKVRLSLKMPTSG